jgi:hypothetical protein
MNIEKRKSRSENGNWLPDMDLNHDKQIQSLLCYRYTIGQMGATKVEVSRRESRLPGMDNWVPGLTDSCPQEGQCSGGRPVNPSINQSTPLFHD